MISNYEYCKNKFVSVNDILDTASARPANSPGFARRLPLLLHFSRPPDKDTKSPGFFKA